MITQIRILRDDVVLTDAYKSLGKIQQMLVLKRNNIVQIEHGVNLLKNISLEKFEKEHNFNWNNSKIIKELYEKMQGNGKG